MIRVDGDVSTPTTFDFAALARLPEQVADIAVLVPGRSGGAVRLSSLLAAAGARATAQFATLRSSDGFAICVPLAPLLPALLAYRVGDAPLPDGKGGPARLYIPGVEKCGTPGIDACAQVKALVSVELTAQPTAAEHRH